MKTEQQPSIRQYGERRIADPIFGSVGGALRGAARGKIQSGDLPSD